MLVLGNTQLHCPERRESLRVEDEAVGLQLADGEMLRARLVIAADGAGSRVRELLNVTHERRDYAQSAIVTAVRTRRPHRGCAYERITKSEERRVGKEWVRKFRIRWLP